MTADEFRDMALGFPGAFESTHMDHPDFRFEGKIFATLGHPDETMGMIKLTPEQQRLFVGDAPNVFSPCSGVWGQRGATSVHLASMRKNTLRAALKAAYGNICEQMKKKIARPGR